MKRKTEPTKRIPETHTNAAIIICNLLFGNERVKVVAACTWHTSLQH